MKLALGTAQFGLNYGVSNRAGQVSEDEVKSILKVAKDYGIDTLDTAAAYGDSEEVLGRAGVSGFRLISKIPPLPDEIGHPEEWVKATVERSLEHLKQPVLAALLFHRPLELMTRKGARLFKAASDLKEASIVERIGVSIYSPSDLEQVIPAFDINLVQAPLSIIDRRLVSSGWLTALSRKGIEVHARSAFLQGLLLMRPDERPAYFKPWKNELKFYNDWLSEKNLSPLEATLGYIKGLKEVDRLVVGVNSAKELKENIKAMSVRSVDAPDSLAVDDEALVNPSRWQL